MLARHYSLRAIAAFSKLIDLIGVMARRLSVAAGLTLALGLTAANAQTTTVLLTVTGGPDAQGQPFDTTFDMAALQALPKTSFETTTMWTEGMQRFDGVDLRVFLDSLQVEKGIVVAMAINDYRIEIPVEEIKQGGAMIAYMRNGAPMSIRDKGPLWIVYPYDSAPEFQSEVVFSRSIWQLDRLEITP